MRAVVCAAIMIVGAYANNGDYNDTVSLLQTRAIQILPKCIDSNMGLGCCLYGEKCLAGAKAKDGYTLGASGNIDCPAGYNYINNEADCWVAASVLHPGKPHHSFHGTASGVPSGCNSNWPSVEQAQFNTATGQHNMNGLSFGDQRRICKKSEFTRSNWGEDCPAGYGVVDDKDLCIGTAVSALGKEYGGSMTAHKNYFTGCVMMPLGGNYELYEMPNQYVMWHVDGQGTDGFRVCQQTTTTTTTTTVLNLDGLDEDERTEEIADEQSHTYECAKWCYSKKHANKPWIGKKCDWYACRTCEECSA